MDQSPIDRLLAALDRLDIDAVVAMLAPDASVLTVDGQSGKGIDAARDVLVAFLSGVRSTAHRVTAQWHEENVWIAEVEADYVLKDWLQITGRPRAFILRDGPDGIVDLRVYGAHEQSFRDRPNPEAGTWMGERWIPPL